MSINHSHVNGSTQDMDTMSKVHVSPINKPTPDRRGNASIKSGWENITPIKLQESKKRSVNDSHMKGSTQDIEDIPFIKLNVLPVNKPTLNRRGNTSMKSGWEDDEKIGRDIIPIKL